MTPNTARITFAVPALIAFCVFATACSSAPSAPAYTQSTDRPFSTTRNAPIPRAATDGPIVAGDAQGLEAHWWIADDAHRDIPRLLEPFLDHPLPESPALRASWDAAGLRLVRFPLSKLPKIRAATTPLSEHNRNWHHAAAVWVELFRGRPVNANNTFRVSRNTYAGPPGTLRLIARIAVLPAASRAAVVRLELVAQVHTPQTDANNVFALPRETTLLEDGAVFNHLTLRADLEPGFAYAITAEAPGVLWRDAAPADNADPRDLSPDPIAPNPGASFGPTSRATPTLGQALLTTSRTESGSAPGRALLVLVPRAPTTYSLLR